MITRHLKNLPGSKWTALEPIDRERHFVVVGVAQNSTLRATEVTLEAVLTGTRRTLSRRELADEAQWQPGWN